MRSLRDSGRMNETVHTGIVFGSSDIHYGVFSDGTPWVMFPVGDEGGVYEFYFDFRVIPISGSVNVFTEAYIIYIDELSAGYAKVTIYDTLGADYANSDFTMTLNWLDTR